MGKAQEMSTARRRLITFKEGLKHLRVGRTKAYELIDAGKIIAYKQGHQTMIDADSIDLPSRPPPHRALFAQTDAWASSLLTSNLSTGF